MSKYFKIFLWVLFFGFHFSRISAQNGTWFWADEGIGDGFVWSIASDTKGDCYLAGLFPNDTIHFGGFMVMNSTTTNPPYSSDWDAYIVKYAPNGNLLWATQTFEKNSNPNTGGNDLPESVCTDYGGSVYLSGNFIDTLFIGSYTFITKEIVPYSQNMYLSKYSSNGNLLWAKQAICGNDSSFINSTHISCDNSGNVYVTGNFSDTILMGSNKLTAPAIGINTFLAKYDTNGNIQWVEQSTGNVHDNNSFGVVNNRYGNSFITGNFYDSVTFGAYTVRNANPNNSDFFIVKYAANGNVLWAKTAITPGPNSYTSGAGGWAVTTDQSGNSYVAGFFQDSLIFGLDTLADSNNSFFLVKYDLNGNVLWAKSAKVLDNNDWYIGGLSSDNSKHIYLTANGYGEGPGTDIIAFAGDTLSIKDTAENGGPSVIFKLDSNGNVLCSSIIPIGGDGDGSDPVASDTSGSHVYLGAIARSIGVFGKDTVNPLGYPINPIQHGNAFPFAARWEECDSNVLYAGVQNPKPINAEAKVYPNPSNGIFNVVISGQEQGISEIQVYNVMGEKISQIAINNSQTTIDLSAQPNGIYFYRVVSESGNLVGEGKVVIEK